MMPSCVLCGSPSTSEYFKDEKHFFLVCRDCTTVFRHPENRVSLSAEKERYLAHHNNVEDAGYQNFVKPLVELVSDTFPTTASGLDFGAGTGPVAAKLLLDEGFSIALYDPFFHPDASVLNTTYDFIICCEVIEHFHEPLKEFKLLRSLLKPNGKLFCMTNPWNGNPEEFSTWWYKNDSTHTLFYNATNLSFLQKTCNFKHISMDRNIIEIS